MPRSLENPPPGTRFEITSEGFVAEASTRSWMALFLIPFTCLWAVGSVGHMYGSLSGSGFDPGAFFSELPFLLASLFLIAMCAMCTFGVVRLTRVRDEFLIFTGVGQIGWRRKYNWSDFRIVRDEDSGAEGWTNREGRLVVLEGRSTRAAFGLMLSGPKRDFLFEILRAMLANG
jgi:hypothetical protein